MYYKKPLAYNDFNTLSWLCNSLNLIGSRNQENQLMLPDGVCVIIADLAGDKINSYISDEVSERMQDVS